MTKLAILVLVAAPQAAFAYSDPGNFADDAVVGGGAGRYFTGARAEGYSCNVCHRGGPAPNFVIDPLPDDLQSGTQYALVIHWADPQSPQALQLELANPNGSHPTVNIPATASVPATSRCEQMANGSPAIYRIDVGARRIVGVEDCGASRIDVTFGATGDPIEVSIGGVRSNEDGTPDGDGVFEKRFVLSPELRAGGSGCSAHRPSGLSPLLGGLLFVRRRRRSGKLEPE